MSNVRQSDLASAVLAKVQETYADAMLAFDPIEGLQKTIQTVYVIPDNIEFDISSSAGRNKLVGLHAVKYITITMSKGYDQPGTNGDIAPWSESKALLDEFEDMARAVLKTDYANAQIISAEMIRADAEVLDNRHFYTALLIGFQNVC